MHPYITLAIAEQRSADMRSRAAAWRLAKAIKAGAARSRREQRLLAADRASEVPRMREDISSTRPLASSRR